MYRLITVLASLALILAGIPEITAAPVPTYLPVLPNCEGVVSGNKSLPITCAPTTFVIGNTQLAALVSPAGVIARRLGFTVAGDGGAADYISNALSCAGLGRTSNGGDCLDSTAAPISWTLVVPAGPISPKIWGAKCDGTTVDTNAFASAFTAVSLIGLPPQSVCIVGNEVITANQTFDCRGSILQAATGANWILKKTGFNSTVQNCAFNDPSLTEMKTTQLATGGASPGDTTLNVLSSANFQINMVATVQLVSGAYWTSKITGVGVGTITIADPIPSTVSGTPTVASAGSGWVDQQNCILKGGNGPPVTGTISVSAGAITAFAVNSPGLYQTPPSSPVAVVCPSTGAAFNGSVNVIWGGAVAGAFVDAAFGSYMIDNATEGHTTNITIAEAPVGLEILDSNGTGSAGESIDNVNMNAIPLVGFAKLVNVNNIDAKHVFMFGFPHHASSYGAAGLYIDGDSPTTASGGSKYDVLTLGFEIGGLDLNGTLDVFANLIHDTTRNYGFACIGCNSSTFTSLWTTFSGPLASSLLGSHAGKGVGAYFGSSAINNTIGTFYSVFNMSDLHMGDVVSSLWLNSLSWGPSKIMTGFTTSLYPGYTLLSWPTLSISSMTSPVYTAPGVTSSTQTVSAISGTQGNITSFWVATSTPPQAASYQALIYLNRWNRSATVTAASVAAGGSGGTNGACSALTVGGGTGTAAVLSGTITANALAGALTVVTAGAYTFTPPYPATVTGCGLTGATVNLTMTNYPDGWKAFGSCTWTGNSPGCLYTGPSIVVFPEDQIEMVMAVVGGGSFPSNLTFNAYVNGQ